MRLAVCDDSLIDRSLLTLWLQTYFSEHAYEYEVVPFQRGMELLREVEDGAWFDIVFLDIYMERMTGLETAAQMRRLGYDGSLIFLSASADYAVESYDVLASGYLLKPLCGDKLYACLDRLTRQFEMETLQVRQGRKVVRVPYNEILFIESQNSKCIVHRWGGAQYTVYCKLAELESQLKSGRFLRCHQSFIVNMDYVGQVDTQFHLTTGDVVHIRQKELKAIRKIYLDYLAGKAE